MTTLIHIADRVLNRPLLVTPDKAQVILSVLSGRIGIDSPEASRFEGSEYDRDDSGRVRGVKPYRVSGGVAIVTITGSLVNRGAWIGASSGLTSYEGIQHQLKTALADPQVTSVILDISSPGGEAVGAFETAAIVRQLAAAKPTVALVNGMAASAAYAIASGASEIVTIGTGVSGSIGVVLLHADFSRKLEQDGISPTLIFAGAHKVDGNPFEPLPEAVRNDLQAEVNAFYEQFLATVAEGRGIRTSIEDARATQARTFIGAEAVKARLADRVGTFEEVLADLKTRNGPGTGRATVQKGRPTMDADTVRPGSDASAITREDHEAALATARSEATSAERARITGVLSYLGRGQDAIVLACVADGSSKGDTAMKVLEAGPAAPASSKTPQQVLEAMDKAAEGISSSPSAEVSGKPAKAPAATTPEGWKAEWEASADLQADYPSADSYIAYQKREARRAAA